MPVNKSLAKNLKKRYGDKQGESVYFALEHTGGKAFKKGLKTASKEGHTAAHMKDLKKKKRVGKGQSDEAAEAKMTPKQLTAHERREKKEMGAKKFAAHERAEKKAEKKPAKKSKKRVGQGQAAY